MILVVDDDEQVRGTLARVLGKYDYAPRAVATAAQARAALRDRAWELVLCDVRMPEESGINLLHHIRTQHPDLPVVMISGVVDPAFAAGALDLGAYGYVTKPFDANQVLIAVANALRRATLETENSAYREQLEEKVRERTADLGDALARVCRSEEQLRLATEDTVRALSRAIEGRDVETGQHIERMSRYAALLASRHGFTTRDCDLMRLASPMHDVGKLGVPDGILFKPGRLSAGEFDVIKQHPDLGYEILAKSEQPLLVMAATIARSHHERWDGAGYPQGLSGEDIPVEARIAAVADVFDALVSRRVYKPAFSLERSLQIMRERRATHFDPVVVDLLLDNIDEVVAIHEQYGDE
ncbi:MAG: Response regulator with domain [Acidimicrobiales bacterium]|nr:Response regulator with domain [Acidimicrobiales bacterium]